jgi:hypothetical protein
VTLSTCGSSHTAGVSSCGFCSELVSKCSQMEGSTKLASIETAMSAALDILGVALREGQTMAEEIKMMRAKVPPSHHLRTSLSPTPSSPLGGFCRLDLWPRRLTLDFGHTPIASVFHRRGCQGTRNPRDGTTAREAATTS